MCSTSPYSADFDGNEMNMRYSFVSSSSNCTWSSALPAASWGLQTPAAYSPLDFASSSKEGHGSHNTLKPLVSPYDPSAVQPILWPGDGAVGFRDIQKDGKTVQSHQH